jgi:hypothetical protein
MLLTYDAHTLMAKVSFSSFSTRTQLVFGTQLWLKCKFERFLSNTIELMAPKHLPHEACLVKQYTRHSVENKKNKDFYTNSDQAEIRE